MKKQERTPLKLMYITNKPDVAIIAQDAGVDRIFVDMEYIGKEQRQAGLDTVKSHHTINDVKNIKKVMNKSELLVRINPIHDENKEYVSTEKEVDLAIEAGADILMLPMFKTVTDVKRFLKAVDSRAKTVLLLENAEAVQNLDDILMIPGIDEMHIGLNDLHLSYGMDFMFQLISDGTVEKLCKKMAKHNMVYGFGGIARIGYGELPAEYIITEHYALGSRMAILSRDFCNAKQVTDLSRLKSIFENGIAGIREYEQKVLRYSNYDFELNHQLVCKKVNQIVARRKHNER